jgi:hypothetical protein
MDFECGTSSRRSSSRFAAGSHGTGASLLSLLGVMAQPRLATSSSVRVVVEKVEGELYFDIGRPYLNQLSVTGF